MNLGEFPETSDQEKQNWHCWYAWKIVGSDAKGNLYEKKLQSVNVPGLSKRNNSRDSSDSRTVHECEFYACDWKSEAKWTCELARFEFTLSDDDCLTG